MFQFIGKKLTIIIHLSFWAVLIAAINSNDHLYLLYLSFIDSVSKLKYFNRSRLDLLFLFRRILKLIAILLINYATISSDIEWITTA